MRTKITHAFIVRIFQMSRGTEIVLAGESLGLLLRIGKTMERLAPADNGGTRQFWFEVFEAERPHWYLLSTKSQDNHVYLNVTDRDKNTCTMSSRYRENGHYENMKWFLKPFLEFVMSNVDYILSNTDEHNDFVEENLPYRQRIGTIKRIEFNRIFPHFRVMPKDFKRAADVLHILVERNLYYENMINGSDDNGYCKSDRHEYPQPLQSINSETDSKYFRIVDECFFHIEHDEKVSDVEYYRKIKFGDKKHDIKSDADLKRYVYDYHREVPLSKANFHLDYKISGRGFIIVFDIIHSTYIAEGIDIVIALYDSGAPFILSDAENLLGFLEERDSVMLMANDIVDKVMYPVWSVYSLPYERDCGKEDEISREQYDAIVKFAEWRPELAVPSAVMGFN